jgi:hypothetical protein
MKKFQAKNSNKKFVCTANVSPKGEISGLTCQAAQEKSIARTEKHLAKAENWLDTLPADIKSQYEAYQEAAKKKTALTSKLNVTSKHHHHSHSSSSSSSRQCYDNLKSFVGKWNIAVPQKREWIPQQMAAFDQSFNFIIVQTKFIVELAFFLSIEYYTESGDVYGLVVGDGFHPTTISPTGPVVGKISPDGNKLKLTGTLDDDFLGLCNFLWSVAGSTKSGLPISNFSLELELDGNKSKGKTNFNPDSANVISHCHGKRVNYNTSDNGPSVLGKPEVLIGPDTTDFSNFSFGNGWLLYTPFNTAVDSWIIEAPSDPTKSAQFVTIHGPLFNGFGESLFTRKRYDNYKLSLEVYMGGESSNSGIYLRDAWEIQLGFGPFNQCADGGDLAVITGAVYSMIPPIHVFDGIPGTDPNDDSQWVLVEITVIDQTLTIFMNGNLLQQQTLPPLGNAIATGTQQAGRAFQNDPQPIGLQNHTGDVRFRNMVVTPIISLCDD